MHPDIGHFISHEQNMSHQKSPKGGKRSTGKSLRYAGSVSGREGGFLFKTKKIRFDLENTVSEKTYPAIRDANHY